MGSPIASIIAEIFLQDFEHKHIDTLKQKYNIKEYIRYVDDILCILETDNAEHLLEEINTKHAKIQFTLEKENNDSINFLDLNIKKSNNKLEFKIHRKPTQTSCIIHNTSNHPYKQKIAALDNYVHRLITTPMSKSEYNNEINILKSIALENGYAPQIINNIIKRKRKNKNKIKQSTSNEAEEHKKWITFTYTGNEIYNITKLFKPYNLKIAYKTNNTITRKLINNIETKNIYEQNGVYSLQCNTCTKVYIGQTGRKFKERYTEHIRAIKNQKTNSQFANHVINENHSYDNMENSMKILKIEKKGRNLTTNEFMYIHKNKHNVINEYTEHPARPLFNTLKQINNSTHVR